MVPGDHTSHTVLTEGHSSSCSL